MNQAAVLKCTTTSAGGVVSREASFEVGVQFDMSARASVRIRFGILLDPLLGPLRAGSIRLFGGFGSTAYARLAATASTEFAPSTLTLH